MDNETKVNNPKVKPPSKLKFPNKLPSSTSTLLKELDVVKPKASNLNEKPLTALPRRFQVRRSKSFSDLRSVIKTVPFKPTSCIKTKISKPVMKEPIKKIPDVTMRSKTMLKKPPVQSTESSGSIQAAPKRSATDKPIIDSKPKVSKPVKPAPYDYKARYNLLHEKHVSLVEQKKDMHKQLADALELVKESETLKVEIERLKTDITALNLEIAKTMAEIKKLQSENQDLRHELKETKFEAETFKAANISLRNHVTSLNQEIETIDETNKSIKNLNEELSEELEITKLAVLEQNKTIDTYKSDLKESEDLRRILHNTIQDMKGNIRVFCRVRPPLNNEEDRMLVKITIPDETSLEIKKSTEIVSNIHGKSTEQKQDFIFDRVFRAESSQDEVFEDLAQLVQSALDGYNVCVFAYGQTGSGKTFTMQGTEAHLGMIPKTINLLFHNINHLEKAGWKYTVQASFLEIYNECVQDLLDPYSTQNHEILFNEGKGVIITNLTIETISTAAELINLMYTAQKNRATAATDFNEHSSRSHAVTKIMLEGWHQDSEAMYQSSLNLVDLAGSESAKTSANERITETKNINKSLSTLGTVMLALHNHENHVPYRNSKLTYLLQSCLSGNSKTLMFVNISPFEDCYNETVNSLRFAAKVKEVKIGSKRNKFYRAPPPLYSRPLWKLDRLYYIDFDYERKTAELRRFTDI